MWIGTRSRTAIATLTLVALFGAAACGDDDGGDGATDLEPESGETTSSMAGEADAGDRVDSKAAGLRADLTALLGEHVYLAALTTGAALRGDTKAQEAFTAALTGPTDSNSAALAAAIGSIYGEATGKAFDGLWRSEKHIPAFVAYTVAASTGDQAGKDAALESVKGYATDFGNTLHSVNENLPAADLTAGLIEHANTLTAVIDAQAAKDYPAVYTSLRKAYHHMDAAAAALAGGTAAKYPEAFPGNSDSKAATLRAGMTSLLREHVYLAASATGAALGGRDDAFTAAAGALNAPEGDSNTADIVAAVTSFYGEDTGKAFEGLWRSEKHIPAFVAYTQAVANGDDAAKKAAVEAATAYATDFGNTMNQVNENLPAADVTKNLIEHIETLTAVIDAQKAGDFAAVAKALKMAADHMNGTATVLATATMAKFPDKF